MTDNGLLMAIAMVIATLMTLSQWQVFSIVGLRVALLRWVVISALEWPVAMGIVWGVLYIAYALYFNSPP
jgi:hypothetical protein